MNRETWLSHRLTINVDLDGVLCDFVDVMAKYVEDRHYDGQVHLTREPREWATWVAWGITKQEFWQYLYDGVEQGIVFRYGADILGAKYGFDRLRSLPHPTHVRVVTSKLLSGSAKWRAQINAIEWLRDGGYDYDELIFVRGAAAKRAIPCDVAIDDKPSYAWMGPGLNILFAQPWNQDWAEQQVGRGKFSVAYSWDDVVALVDRAGYLGRA